MAADHARLLRALQIIVGAMAAGTLAFAAVVAALPTAGDEAPPDEPLLTWLAAAVAVMSLFMWQLLPRAVAARGRRQIAAGTFAPPAASGWPAELGATEEGRLLLLYQSCTVLGAAVLEAPALFLCAAYLVEGVSWALGLGVGFGILMLLAEFPTPARAERWTDAQRRLLAEERALPLQ